ncbi:MAG: DUF4249 domain-containing protein, partial [Bacteroidales bacterium]|nr:DUF4249 domain-containing protein [Bacteroidales bacterium]
MKTIKSNLSIKAIWIGLQTFCIPLMLLIGFIQLNSCISDAEDIEIPEVEPKLVVHCFISPDDDTITLKLGQTRPLNNSTVIYDDWNQQNPIVNASVQISNQNGDSKTLTYSSLHQSYILPCLDFPIEVNKSYYLSVSAPDFKSISASCTVPAPNQNIIVNDVITQQINEYSTDYIIKAQITDIPNVENYYHFQIYLKSAEPYLNPKYQTNYYTQMDFQIGESFFSDKNLDGAVFPFVAKAQSSSPNNSGISEYKLILLTTDEHYYRYHTSLNIHQSPNPFIEPTILYSNIINGSGVFCAYNKYTMDYS